MKLPVIAAYAGMCLIWGTTWLAIKYNAFSLGPALGVGLRFAIAGVLLFGVAAARRELRPVRAYPWKVILVVAAFMFALNYGLIYVAERKLDSGLVSVIYGTLPFLTLGFAHVMDRAVVSRRALIGALVAFCGLVLMSLEGQIHASPLYALAAIGAAASAAFANVYAKRHAHHSPFVTLPPAMLTSGAVMTAFALAFERIDWSAVTTPATLGALLYLAVFGSGIAFLLYLWVLRNVSAWTATLAALIIPVIALLVGWAAGGELLDGRKAIGALLVISGSAIALIPIDERRAFFRRWTSLVQSPD